MMCAAMEFAVCRPPVLKLTTFSPALDWEPQHGTMLATLGGHRLRGRRFGDLAASAIKDSFHFVLVEFFGS